jgi:hypothetical protein
MQVPAPVESDFIWTILNDEVYIRRLCASSTTSVHQVNIPSQTARLTLIAAMQSHDTTGLFAIRMKTYTGLCAEVHSRHKFGNGESEY